MSTSSFPRAEHIALLRSRIESRLRAQGLPLEAAERGLNQMKCQYRFGLRRLLGGKPPSAASESTTESREAAANDWIELPIHFQVAQRLEEDGSETELDRILEAFLARHFPDVAASARWEDG